MPDHRLTELQELTERMAAQLPSTSVRKLSEMCAAAHTGLVELLAEVARLRAASGDDLYRQIEVLEQFHVECKRLRALNVTLCNRVAAASEVLSRAAERKGNPVAAECAALAAELKGGA